MASCEYGEGMAFGSEAAAGGFDPATSNKQIPAHLAIATPPREAHSSFSNPCYMNYEYCEKRVLRVASITSTKKKMGAEVTAGGFEPATSNKQIPAHLRIASPPREARASFLNPCYMNGWLCEGGEPKTQERKTSKTARVSTDAARRITTRQP